MRAIPCPIEEKELRYLYGVEKKTDLYIADRLTLQVGWEVNPKHVFRWRKRFGIKTLSKWERYNVPPIEGKLRSLLIGSMLGDGGLSRRVHTTHFSENHCVAQLPYLKWKAELWGAWIQSGIKPVTWKGEKTFYGNYFFTVAHPLLNEWHGLFYSDGSGWKSLVPDIVDLVDEFALAVWFLDDGSAGWWPSIAFGMTESSRQIASTIFDKFGLCPTHKFSKGKTGYFEFNTELVAERFLGIISPHVPPCMGYKINTLGFQGPHYQVRQKLPRDVLERLASEGVPIRRIARDYGVGATTVVRYLDKWGIYHPRKIGRPHE